MSADRTCRACGCVQERACPGGCIWIAADRCSACPVAPLTLPIRAAHVEASALKQVARYSWNNVHRYMHRSVEFPALVVMKTIQGDVITSHSAYVGAMEVPAGDFVAIAEVLESARETA